MFGARMPYCRALTACPEPNPASSVFPIGIAKFRRHRSEPYLSRLDSSRQGFVRTKAFRMKTLHNDRVQTSWIHIVMQKDRGEGGPSSETLDSSSIQSGQKQPHLKRRRMNTCTKRVGGYPGPRDPDHEADSVGKRWLPETQRPETPKRRMIHGRLCGV